MTTTNTANPIQLSIPEQTGLEPATVESLKLAFDSYFTQADQWRQRAMAIVVTDATQIREMKLARETRLALRDIRTGAEKTRKRLKADSLAKGKAIDGIYNMLAFAVEPLEAHLQDMELYAERIEQRRLDQLRADRVAQLQAFGVDPTIYPELEAMTQETYQSVLETHILARDAKIEAEKAAEAERVEQEKIAKAERERVREENARLKVEAAEREKAMQAERVLLDQQRAALAAREKADREAREKAEAQLQERARIEQEAKEAADKAARLAQAAPDKAKLQGLMKNLGAIPWPDMSTDRGQSASEQIGVLFIGFVTEANRLIESV